jgi:glutathione S-transferase
MYTLYYSPFVCSLAPHIALREAQLTFQLRRVDLAKGRVEDGGSFREVTPLGYVPALDIPGVGVLTEAAAILQYLDEVAKGPRTLAERTELSRWLVLIATELHKPFGVLFDRTAPEVTVEKTKQHLRRRFDFFETRLQEREFLVTSSFGVADAYLFTVLSWAAPTGLSLSSWPSLEAFFRRVAGRPAVRAALTVEAEARRAAA